MSSDDKFEYESYEDTRTIRQYFLALIEGFEQKEIKLDSEANRIILPLNEFLKFKVKARKKGEKNKIDISISWNEAVSSPKTQKIKIGA